MDRHIKTIYKDFLLGNKVLTSESLDWSLPHTYKITVCSKLILTPDIGLIVRPVEEYDYASIVHKQFIFRPEEIYECHMTPKK